jgi:hypothetical protein
VKVSWALEGKKCAASFWSRDGAPDIASGVIGGPLLIR